MRKRSVSIIIISMCLLCLSGCGLWKKKIDVTKTLSLKFNGVNGYGTADLVDAYLWEDEAFKKAGIKDLNSLTALGNAFAIENAVSYDISPSEDLSNGDKVTVTASINKEVAKNYKLKLTAKERQFTVEGLPEVQEVDLFENVNVTFDGIAPYVTASIDNSYNEKYVFTTFSLDKNSGLNIGDVVTVSANYDNERLLESGYKAKSDTKEFKVEETDRYAVIISEISQDIFDKMQKQAEDAIKASVSKWKNPDHLQSIDYCGSYLLDKKVEFANAYGPYNMIYLIFKVNVKTPEEEFSYYSYCKFEDIVILKDETCSLNLANYDMPEGSAFFGNVSGEAFVKGEYYYIGYEDITSLFNQCVTKNIEYYEYESSVKE